MAGMARPATLLVLTACLSGCWQPATGAEAPAAKKSAAPASPSDRWSPERVRGFLLGIQGLIDADIERARKTYKGSDEIGECYGESAIRYLKTAEVLPRLQTRLTGRALDCYVASYYGCQIGEWLAVAGVASNGPSHIVYPKSPVKVIQQSADRVVADVTEANYEALAQGSVGRRDQSHSRYTLTRDSQGVWRVSDRVPAFEQWECRPK
jgi:hypothetical protein